MMADPQDKLQVLKGLIPRGKLTWKVLITRNMLTWKALMPERMLTCKVLIASGVLKMPAWRALIPRRRLNWKRDACEVANLEGTNPQGFADLKGTIYPEHGAFSPTAGHFFQLPTYTGQQLSQESSPRAWARDPHSGRHLRLAARSLASCLEEAEPAPPIPIFLLLGTPSWDPLLSYGQRGVWLPATAKITTSLVLLRARLCFPTRWQILPSKTAFGEIVSILLRGS